MNREDFPILKNNIVYLDSGATTLKPKCVIDSVVDYYSNYSANAHRGDYDISLRVNMAYEGVRGKVKDFINASLCEEIIFTKGTTESLNMVVFGYMAKYLKSGDEVLISKSEHASNILPWMILKEKIGIEVNYIDLDENHSLKVDSVKKSISSKTKVISLAHITNVIGDVRDIDAIGEICKENNILFVVDGAQSVGHRKIDVIKSNISFLAFSAHKMLGPTGVGVLYGRKELLEDMDVLEFGGGMNTFFESDCSYELKELPWKLEAGTQNIAGVIGLGSAIDYLNSVSLDNIHEHEVELKKYAISEIEKIPNINLYNKDSDSGIIVFNINNVFSQDTAVFLNRFNICVRSGNHCAKLLKDEIGITNTCRASLYIYNTKSDIDKLVEALKRQDEVYDNLI